MAFLTSHDVQELLNIADQVINPEDIFPVDGGVVLRRHVGSIENKDSQPRKPFIQWFHQHIIRTLLENTSQQLEKLSTTRRVHVLAGRAGQGKSTLMRHAFLHVKRQWDEENPRIQPNFGFDNEGNNLDDSFAEFYRRFVDRTHYIQARNVGPKNELRLTSRGSHLILFDGIDEANEENLATIHEFIEKHPQCVFLLSSRTRRQPSRLHQDHEEIINLNRFSKLCDENALRKHAAMLHPMGEREKKDMMRIMEEHEPEREFSFLKTLVENNSRTLQVPADFLLYRAKSPKTKSEYYLHHLRWLIDREDSKDVEERQRLVSQFQIPLHDEISFERIDEGRIYVDISKDNLEPYLVFNLLESKPMGQSMEYYFDMDTSSARALILLTICGIDAHTLLSDEKTQNENALSCVSAVVNSEFGQDFIRTALDDIQLNSYSCNIWEPLACMLNGYGKILEGTDIFRHLPVQSGNSIYGLNSNVNFLLWLFDVFHPIDELDVGFKSEPYHDIISENINQLFGIEIILAPESEKLVKWLKQKVDNRILTEYQEEFPKEKKRDRSDRKAFLIERLNTDETQEYNDIITNASMWLENRAEHWYRLLLRISQQGPGLDIEEDLESVLKPKQIELEKTLVFHEKFILMVLEIIEMYGFEEGGGTSELKREISKLNYLMPNQKNTKSQQRIFTTICGVLGLDREYKNSVFASRFLNNKFDFIVKFLEPYSIFPERWNVENFIKLGNLDLIQLQFARMDQESQDAERILQHFVDIGLDPNLSYLHLDNNKDMLLKSVKFLALANSKSKSTRLETIMNSYIAMSRMGHMANKYELGWNNTKKYKNKTTCLEDINKYAWNSKQGDLLSDYDAACSSLLQYFSEKRPVPPIFHWSIQTSGHNNPIHALRTYNLNFANSLETIYPKIDYRSGDLPKLLNSDFVNELLKLNSPEFLEQYAAFSSLIPKTDVTNELSLAVHDGIMFWIQRGQFLVALVYALRTARVDVVSILLHAVLDEEDGFDQMRSKLIGNYLHRRVYSSKPDYWDLESSILASLEKKNITRFKRFFTDSLGDEDGEPIDARITGFLHKSVPVEISPEELRNCFENGKVSLRKKDDFNKIQFVFDTRPRPTQHDRVAFKPGYKIQYKDSDNEWKWLTTDGFYWSKVTVETFMKLFLNEYKDSIDNPPSNFEPPPNVGSLLESKETRVFSSWHTVPFFSKYLDSLENVDFEAFNESNESVKQLITHHATQDEQLSTGMSFKLSESPFFNVQPHRTIDPEEVTYEIYSAGKRNIITDSYGKPEKKVSPKSEKHISEEIVSFDLRMHPNGFRTLIEGFKHIFEGKKSKEMPLEGSPSKDFFLASSYLGSLTYSHSHTNNYSHQSREEKKRLRKSPHGWLRIDYLTSRIENPVYGYKFGIYSPEHPDNNVETQGFAEYTTRSFTSRKERKILTTFVEVMDSESNEDNRFAHSSWKSLLCESEEIPKLLRDALILNEETKGVRAKRVFGIVVDHGRIDEYKLDCINEAMHKVEQNLEQLRKKERVIAGRENLVNAIREFSVTYLHCDWLPGYLEAFSEQKNRMESIMQAIETEERNQMGQSLEGTVLDFTTIRAMLDGLEYKANKLHREIEETFESTLEMLNSETFANQEESESQFLSLKETIRRLCLYLNSPEKLSSLRDAMIKAFPNMPRHEISRHCRQRRRMKVRVLGMPQDNFPYAILTSWDEVVGSLMQDPLTCQVGTLVRLDIKPLRRAGNSKVIVTNIAAAVDELDENGQLREEYAASWPPTLKKTDTLPLSTKDEDIMNSGEKNRLVVPLYIKRTRAYACHPELNIDLPIFDSKSVPKEFTGQLRTCTIDIRRDRKRGLFRYYVIDVQ